MVHSAQDLGYREVPNQVNQPFEPSEMFLQILSSAPVAISVKTSLNRQFPGGAFIVYYIQRGSVELDPLRIGFWARARGGIEPTACIQYAQFSQ